MNSPKVSVIIPVYDGADYLAGAVQSVLDQTYQDFEIIVVNDASSDQTSEVVNQFDDPRIKYIEHEENRGANVARNTGIRVASGEILAFLDQDDIFHPAKLQAHVAFLAKHPDVGFTYNARFELNHSAKTIREIWRPPSAVTLADLVLGYPMSPTDMVIRRDWAFQVGLWHESRDFNGGEIIFTGRLYLSGCKFASVGRALNYRRYYAGRIFGNLYGKCRAERGAQEKIFADPRCPAEILALRNTAFMNTYLGFAYLAFAQEETLLGQEFIREAIRLNPGILDGKPSLMDLFVMNSIADESMSHESVLQRVFAQLPPELAWLSEQYDWAVARGYLLRGTRAIMWGRTEAGRDHFARAATLGAKVDESFLRGLTAQLLSYETEFGPGATRDVLRNLAPFLEKVGNRAGVRWLMGCYSVNQAFRSYHAGEYAKVPKEVLSAMTHDPQYLTNRGVIAILIRSTIGVMGHKSQISRMIEF